ncbi:hypothetical protein, partial [Pedobacter sp. Leaf194]|uniref:hypothetical protein n=1 Tax=Pedobacter sp. Leaf194 TaxID=1736297 RepID=UPI000A47D3E1
SYRLYILINIFVQLSIYNNRFCSKTINMSVEVQYFTISDYPNIDNKFDKRKIDAEQAEVETLIMKAELDDLSAFLNLKPV